jgi:hypothetical protein
MKATATPASFQVARVRVVGLIVEFSKSVPQRQEQTTRQKATRSKFGWKWKPEHLHSIASVNPPTLRLAIELNMGVKPSHRFG